MNTIEKFNAVMAFINASDKNHADVYDYVNMNLNECYEPQLEDVLKDFIEDEPESLQQIIDHFGIKPDNRAEMVDAAVRKVMKYLRLGRINPSTPNYEVIDLVWQDLSLEF